MLRENQVEPQREEQYYGGGVLVDGVRPGRGQEQDEPGENHQGRAHVPLLSHFHCLSPQSLEHHHGGRLLNDLHGDRPLTPLGQDAPYVGEGAV